MGSMIQGHELSLHCTPTYIPRNISEFLGQISMIGNVSERLMKLDEYITRLEDEMKKIDAFKRELPLCMLLLNDAILAVKEEAKQCKKSNAEPVLEEFIPLKKSCEGEDGTKVEIRKENDSREKMNWLSSVQLWNSSNDCQHSNLDLSNSNNEQNLKPELGKRTNEGVNHLISNDPFKTCRSQSMGIAFVPFKGYTSFPITAVRKEKEEELPGLPGLSLQTPGIKTSREGPSGLRTKTSDSGIGSVSAATGQSSVCSGSKSQQQQTTRKQRRCWSPELHRRFVEALEQLGGTQVATPKQIRELMQVDGLTNDEVKSHLQKYRLHTRRTPATSAPTSNQTGVLLEGLWPSRDHHQYGDSSKQSNSQSGSPQGPLQFGRSSRGTSLTGGNSMEDEDDEKSESHSWKSHAHS